MAESSQNTEVMKQQEKNLNSIKELQDIQKKLFSDFMISSNKSLNLTPYISPSGNSNITHPPDNDTSNFLSSNPNFVKSALSKYRPSNFIDLVKRYSIPFHEKHKGQLFCDVSATHIVDIC